MHLSDVVPAAASQRKFGMLSKKRVFLDIDPDCSGNPPTAAAAVDAGGSATLEEIVGSNLCPKQAPTTIGEFVALQECLKRAISLQWPSTKLTSLFVLLRGVRGEEGVKLSGEAIFTHGWAIDAPEGIKAFGDHMVAVYHHLVDEGTEPKSFLSHSEGQHSGLSGIHFLRTLALDEQLGLVSALANKLVVYWERAAAHQIQSADLLACYEAFENSKLMIYFTEDETKKHTIKRLRKQSYNSMDFLRSLCECWTTALGHPKIVPCEKFWIKVLGAQKHRKQVDQMMCEFRLGEYLQVQHFLVKQDAVTWTTLLVLCCEVRQAKRALSLGTFDALVRKVLADRTRWLPEVERQTVAIQAAGAKGSQCFCTRLCIRMQGAFTSDGDEID